MEYPDGMRIMLNDELEIFPGITGRVVCSIDDDQYAPDFPKHEWSDLKTGIVVLTNQNGGIVRFDTPRPTFKLLKRN